MAKVTLQDVADAVGVSRMTVSNAFNRPHKLSQTLRVTILETATELGYGGPDPSARALARGRSGTVGLLDRHLGEAFRDPVSTEFLVAVGDALAERSLALTLVATAGDNPPLGQDLRWTAPSSTCAPPGRPRRPQHRGTGRHRRPVPRPRASPRLRRRRRGARPVPSISSGSAIRRDRESSTAVNDLDGGSAAAQRDRWRKAAPAAAGRTTALSRRAPSPARLPRTTPRRSCRPAGPLDTALLLLSDACSLPTPSGPPRVSGCASAGSPRSSVTTTPTSPRLPPAPTTIRAGRGAKGARRRHRADRAIDGRRSKVATLLRTELVVRDRPRSRGRWSRVGAGPRVEEWPRMTVGDLHATASR